MPAVSPTWVGGLPDPASVSHVTATDMVHKPVDMVEHGIGLTTAAAATTAVAAVTSAVMTAVITRTSAVFYSMKASNFLLKLGGLCPCCAEEHIVGNKYAIPCSNFVATG